MLQIFKSVGGVLKQTEEMSNNSWIQLTNPTQEEVLQIASQFNIDIKDIRASLDSDETSRFEATEGYTLILVDIPSIEIRHMTKAYTTMPLSIIITRQCVITTCLEETIVLRHFTEGKMRGIDISKKMRFIYHILYNNASVYQTYLREIDRTRKDIEGSLSRNTKDKDLIQLHELESNLVYFATSLRANGIVLNKLVSSGRIERYSEDLELLNDAIIENKQAIEMTSIYHDILNGTRELFASIIDNNLNTVMKFMTSITLIMSIPTIISGFYGMNVDETGMPFATSHNAFSYIAIMTIILCILVGRVLKKKDLL